MMGSLTLLLSLVLSTVIVPLVALGYETSTDYSGGHVKGTVTWKGQPVPPKRSNLVLNPDPYYCGRISDGKGWRLYRMTTLGPSHTLGGAIVYLQDIKKGKPYSENPHLLKIQNCVLIPSIQVMHSGERLRIENWDPVQHQLEVFLTSSEGGTRLFGADLQPHPNNRKSDYLWEGKTATPRPGPEQVFEPERTGLLFFRCNSHEYMEGWRLVVPHPYHAQTQESGEFVINDIPPGSYTLMVWHPQGTVETPVRIQAQKTLRLEIQLFPPKTSTQEEESSKPDPFGIDLVGDQHIVPSVELQRWDPSPMGKP